MKLRAYHIPAIACAVLLIALGVGLTLKPAEIPSPLVGKPVPDFALPPLSEGGDGIASADLKAGEVRLVNFFASWCVPCRAEHPQLEALAGDKGLTLYGIAYKDKPDDARAFLDRFGNPFARTAVYEAKAAIDWGVYGVPESYLVAGDGTILYKHIGPIMPEHMETILAEAGAR